MSGDTPLPEFFGRLTTVRSQHEHLGATLQKLEAVCNALEIGQMSLPADANPPVLLAALRDDLARHFAAEESDAHFGLIAQEEPRLLPAIVDLKADHAGMLSALARLVLVAGDEARWVELVAPAQHLIRALRAHERGEALLLQDYFGRGEPVERSVRVL